MSQYQLTPLARFDLREIWTYSVKQWGRPRANRYIRDLTIVIESIAKDPYLGVAADEIRPDYRKHVFGSHMVFYTPCETGVIVVRVLHQQMDASSRLS